MKLCFISSSGGHFDQLLMLRLLIEKYNSYVITEKTDYAPVSDRDLKRIFYVTATDRKGLKFFIKFGALVFQSAWLLIREKPDVIVTTGALSSVPTCLIGKLLGKKVIYIESFAKINSPTLSGRLMYRFADLFIVQWESMRKFYPNAVYGGCIY